MSVKYTVNDNGTFVYTAATGTLRPDEIKKYLVDMANDERLKPGYRELFDMTRLIESLITPASFPEILKLITANPKKQRGSKLAIVAGPEGTFETARQFERLASPDVVKIIVFSDIETAKVWLGVETPEFFARQTSPQR
jgi:hypothetical protein